jgi:hypothetical protein
VARKIAFATAGPTTPTPTSAVPRVAGERTHVHVDFHREDVLGLARAGYIDCEVLKARYLEEVRPYLLSKHECHDQTLELWIEMTAAPSPNTPPEAPT